MWTLKEVGKIWAWATAKFGKDIWREIATKGVLKELWEEGIKKLWKEGLEEAIAKWIKNVSMKDKIAFIKWWMWMAVLAKNASIESVDFLTWIITEKYRQLLVLWKQANLKDMIEQWLIVMLAGKMWWKAVELWAEKTSTKSDVVPIRNTGEPELAVAWWNIVEIWTTNITTNQEVTSTRHINEPKPTNTNSWLSQKQKRLYRSNIENDIPTNTGYNQRITIKSLFEKIITKLLNIAYSY